MHQQQRERVGTFARHMQEVQVDVVQRHLELREGVQPRFLRAPVEAAGPVLHKAMQVIDVRAVFPRITRRLIGKARL